MQTNDYILRTDGLSKHFGGLHALEKLDISIKRGHIHGLIGPNGSGKTTFFNVVTGLLPASEGKIFFDSRDITTLKPNVIANMGVSRTFQRAMSAPGMTVLENVMVGAYVHTSLDIKGTFLRQPFTASDQEEKIRQQALELLELVGLAGSAERWTRDLVWVERQLVQIARSLAAEPRLLLLDEPTSGMGPEESKMVELIIRQIRDEKGITVLMVAHDVRLVTGLSDWITAINFGRKIGEGSAEQIQNDPNVVEAYLGKE